jgi:hypothetical protein
MHTRTTSLVALCTIAAALAHAQGDLAGARERERKRREEIQKKQGGATTTVSTDDLSWNTWKVFRSAKRGFSVQFPSKPVVTDDEITDAAVTTMSTKYCATQNKRVYCVAATDYPADFVKKEGSDGLFDRAEQRAASDFDAQPRTRTPAMFQGHPARNFELQSNMMNPELAFLRFQGRIVLAGTRLYVVTQLLLNNPDTLDIPENFWESFEITAAEAKPAK